MGVNEPVFEEDQTGIDAASLIETVLCIPGSLVDDHPADVRAGPQGFFHPCDGVVCVGIRTTGTSVDVHYAHLRPAKRPGQLGSAIDGHLLAGYRIYSNLTAKEQVILRVSTHIEVEDARIFEEELALLRNEDFERCEIERLKIDFGIGKIRVSREIQDEV